MLSPLPSGEWYDVNGFPDDFYLTVKKALKNPKPPHSLSDKNIGEAITRSCDAHESPKNRAYASVVLVELLVP